MYSLVIAGGFAALEVFRKKPPLSIKNRFVHMTVPAPEAAFVGTLVPTLLGSWFLCRHQLRERRDKMHETLRYRSINKEHEERVQASGTDAPPDNKAGAGASVSSSTSTACSSCANQGAARADAEAAPKKSWWRVW
eukprot:Tamp_21167.p2 GENE.Tamp_21167~~Tamp_21167.p2  ORF type:complete len:159 (-),score=28.72 Tamp_21167:683-1090(-)